MDKKMTRRKFLGKLVAGILGGTIALFTAPIAFYLLPKKEKKKLNIFVDPKGNPIPESSIKEGDYELGLSDEGPVIIVRREGVLYAFSAVCTHLGCIVKWIPSRNEFLCPCHAGRFDANGAVISGPPPAPLKRYKIEITSEGFIILS